MPIDTVSKFTIFFMCLIIHLEQSVVLVCCLEYGTLVMGIIMGSITMIVLLRFLLLLVVNKPSSYVFLCSFGLPFHNNSEAQEKI